MVWTFYCISAFAFWAWTHATVNAVNVSLFLFFFFSRVLGVIGYCASLFSRKCWLFHGAQCIRSLFTDPQIPLFSNFFIKNGSHGTIYIFKKYFATVFSVSKKISSIQIDPEWVFGSRHVFTFVFFAFFFFFSNSNITWIYYAGDKVYCLYTVHRSHNTIHIF